jgi:succinate-semialdehyde dehydrogenase/glutarate-semialdehyde dehydrogenase
MTIASVNPANHETLRVFTPHTDAEVEHRVGQAAGAFPAWRATSFAERAAHMRRAAEVLEGGKADWGRLMTLEMGKPIAAAVAEAEKCATACRYYADHAAAMLADEPAATDASRSFVRYEPLGPVLAVMPWNFPFWQVFRFLAPALMAGNVGLLKHASNVPQCALAIEAIITQAGFPTGVFQTLLVAADRVARLIADDRIRAVTLTGSEGAGVSVGGAAAGALKKTVLELGGSDPFIVMPSARLDDAIATAVKARTINNGQSCIAAKRFIVHTDIAAEFEGRFAERMAALRVGDPLDPATEIGPLATPAILDEVEEQVEKTVAAGARLVTGGRRLNRAGSYFPPTVLVDVPLDSPGAEEEIFGPVASIFRVPSLEAAIALANRSRFGLGASAWTNEPQERERLVAELEAGCVFVNGMVKSDPRLPFGGVKHSGYGRELAAQGIREFVNVKSVWIA